MASTQLKFLLVLFLGIAFRESVAQEREDDMKAPDNTIDPSQVNQLSWHPRVFLYKGFLSSEECDHLTSLAHRKSNGTADPNDSSTKSMQVASSDEISRRIDERISAWTFLPLGNSKGFQVLHFGPETSKNDYQYFDTGYVEQVGQPLLAAVILYLSDVSHGGQIIFPHSQEKTWSDCTKSSDLVRPTRGNAILFFNLNLNASPDRSSSHVRCPVLEGEMWCAIKFFYLKQTKEEKNVLTITTSNEAADCTDEDDNCSSWAANGECEKNPVFMVGSSDYYGTCRRSCNACSL